MTEANNQIPEKQNTERFLEYLAASSHLYGQAKKLNGLEVVLTVPVPIGLLVLALFFPRLRAWSALYGIVIGLVDAGVIDVAQRHLKKTAAKVQERFDCELMGLPWNSVLAGDSPTRELINSAANKYRLNPSPLPKTNWYSIHVGRIPLELARIVCQRSSIVWDAHLRRTYISWITGILAVISAGGLVVALALNLSMEAFVLCLLAPISPTLMWLMRERRRQLESVGTVDRLTTCAHDLWRDALSGTLRDPYLKNSSRTLQDEIYLHRCTNAPIFNWIYGLLRKNHEQAMNIGAEELVDQAVESVNRSQANPSRLKAVADDLV